MNPTTTNPTTTTLSDADKRAIEKHAAWTSRMNECDGMQDIMYGHFGTAAGTAATHLAKVWECSEREAFETATRLARAGHFRFHLHQWSYAFEFSATTFSEPKKSVMRAFAKLPGMLADLAASDESKPFAWQDINNESDAIAFLVAFGKLVSRNFTLYPAPLSR